MILTHHEIEDQIRQERVRFSPALETGQIGGASIDLRLGFRFTRIVRDDSLTVSVAKGPLLREGLWETHDFGEKGVLGKPDTYQLAPKEFVLAMTYESIALPLDIIGLVEGRSKYARVGLSMHQTAPWIQPGWDGQIVLEMMNNGPLTISLQPLFDKPCQLTLFKLSRNVPTDEAYGSRKTSSFQHQDHPFKPK